MYCMPPFEDLNTHIDYIFKTPELISYLSKAIHFVAKRCIFWVLTLGVWDPSPIAKKVRLRLGQNLFFPQIAFDSYAYQQKEEECKDQEGQIWDPQKPLVREKYFEEISFQIKLLKKSHHVWSTVL